MITRRMLIFGLTGLVMAGCRKAPPAPPTATEVQEFHAALLDGDTAIISRLLSAKPALANAPNAQGQTPLQVARNRGDQEMADLLIKRGAR